MQHNLFESIKISDIVNRAFIQLAAIGITGIYELLTVSDKEDSYDGWEVIKSILQDTYDRFEYWEPLVLTQNVFIDSDSFEFIDNFQSVLEGKVPKQYLQLVPRQLLPSPNLSLGSLQGINYDPPYLCINSRGLVQIRCICNRPIVIERDGNGFTDNSRIYYLGESFKPKLLRFRNLFLLNLTKYLIRLMNNTQYPGLPIECLQGLNELNSELSSRVEQDFEITHGYAGIYGR